MVAILFWPQCVKQLFNPLYAGLLKKAHKIHFHVLLVLNLEKVKVSKIHPHRR